MPPASALSWVRTIGLAAKGLIDGKDERHGRKQGGGANEARAHDISRLRCAHGHAGLHALGCRGLSKPCTWPPPPLLFNSVLLPYPVVSPANIPKYPLF